MSAAEPANPTPHGLNQAGDAAVIDISTRAATHLIKGRWKKGMSSRPASTPGPDPQDPGHSMARQVAERIEITFNEHHLTLSDDSTKTAFAVTLRIVQDMLTGAHAQGVVTEDQHRELNAIIDALTDVPRLAHG